MSSEDKAIKALLKSFKKVKSISLVEKVNEAGKTVSSFLFQIESKEGKKSKLEKWMEKLEQEKEPKAKKKKKKKDKTVSDSKEPKKKEEKKKKKDKEKEAGENETPEKEDIKNENKNAGFAVEKTKTETKPTAGDDLKRIEGIGPAVEKILLAEGINSYKKLSKATSEKLMELLLAKGGPRYRMFDPSSWSEQATLAAAGKTDELKALQQTLKGAISK